MRYNKKLTALMVCALLTAIEIILSRFLSISTPIVKISFDFAPMAIAGLLFGPGWGAMVGVAADFLGANLFPIGPFFPGFTVVAGLCGLTYGLLLHPKEGGPLTGRRFWLRTLAAVLIVTLLLQLGLDTLNLYILMDVGVAALIPARAVKALVMIPVQMVTIPALVSLLTRRRLLPGG